MLETNPKDTRDNMINQLNHTINRVEQTITEKVKKGQDIDVWVDDLKRMKELRENLLWFNKEY